MQLKIPSPNYSKKGSKSALGPFKPKTRVVEHLRRGRAEENPYTVYFKGGVEQILQTERN